MYVSMCVCRFGVMNVCACAHAGIDGCVSGSMPDRLPGSLTVCTRALPGVPVCQAAPCVDGFAVGVNVSAFLLYRRDRSPPSGP